MNLKSYWKILRQLVKVNGNSELIPPVKTINNHVLETFSLTDKKKAECINKICWLTLSERKYPKLITMYNIHNSHYLFLKQGFVKLYSVTSCQTILPCRTLCLPDYVIIVAI